MNTRQRRIEKSTRAQKGARLLVKVFILVVVILAAIGSVIFVSHWVKTKMVNGEIVRTGNLDDSVKVPCLVVNKEYVYFAPDRGRFENLLLEGERVRRGSLIGYYYPDGETNAINIRASQSGIVCYHPDNLEEKLSKVNEQNFNVKILDYEPRVINDGSFHFEKGQPVFRMVDNLVTTNLVAEYASSQAVKVGDVFEVKYKGEVIGTAECMNIKGTKTNRILFLSMDKCKSSLMDDRKPDVALVSQSFKGVIVPKDSLLRQNGTLGIYRLVNEIVEFEPVNVLYRRGDRVIVEGLNDGDYVITTPGLVSEGDKF